MEEGKGGAQHSTLSTARNLLPRYSFASANLELLGFLELRARLLKVGVPRLCQAQTKEPTKRDVVVLSVSDLCVLGKPARRRPQGGV